MQSSQARRAFLDFFRQRGHLIMPSSSLVPHNDPTVLLTTAGMQQMIPYFLGAEATPGPRLVSVQKCFRTTDIDEVGDASHLTFFEMLGNFSVGDYFKEGAIRFAWEFMTEVLGLDPDRIWPTTHPDDAVGWDLWRDAIGLPESRLTKLDDNWWGPPGLTGPCGPDSEIYYDLGPEHDPNPAARPGDSERFLEVWNLVFMEYFQDAEGQRTPLPRQNIDTGMGLERLCTILQQTPSIYETDLFLPFIHEAARLTNRVYGRDPAADYGLRVLADHGRAITFLIGDGVLPSNEGRGYILRRILRRAVRYGRQLGLEQPFLGQICAVVIDRIGEHYDALPARAEHILRVIRLEEDQFGRTLASGLTRFSGLAGTLAAEGRTEVSGIEAFRLYDTYGFPIDLTLDLARERGLTVGLEEYESAMIAQRESGRAAQRFREASHQALEFYGTQGLPPTDFLGYTESEADGVILALLGPDGPLPVAEAGQVVEVVLDRTPFYGEAGGQVGDTGLLANERGRMIVDDTQRPAPGLIAHRGRVLEGFLEVGAIVTASIDADRRDDIKRNHTATHLIHRALHLVLGAHATQAGSLVAPDRLRFDFNQMRPLGQDQVRQIEQIANEAVRRDDPVTWSLMPVSEALASGAMALFGEKYGDVVRVVRVGDFSRELCGGTHVDSTGQIGPVLIVTETSIGTGIRRVEALTGRGADQHVAGLRTTLSELSGLLRAPASEVVAGVRGLHERLRESERTIQTLQGHLARLRAADMLALAETVDGVRVLARRAEVDSIDALKQQGDQVRDRLGTAVVALGAVVNNRPALLVMASKDAVARGVNAGTLVKQIAGAMGASGGGRPDIAQAGGGDPAQLDAALAQARTLVEAQLVR
ncbi:MAG: alanine--tRNA ligase [Chloroflexi bacterium]|nr:alanine--tRNA ligase [Chloroflexota bacterium]